MESCKPWLAVTLSSAPPLTLKVQPWEPCPPPHCLPPPLPPPATAPCLLALLSSYPSCIPSPGTVCHPCRTPAPGAPLPALDMSSFSCSPTPLSDSSLVSAYHLSCAAPYSAHSPCLASTCVTPFGGLCYLYVTIWFKLEHDQMLMQPCNTIHGFSSYYCCSY